jgi:hypothetical protein
LCKHESEWRNQAERAENQSAHPAREIRLLPRDTLLDRPGVIRAGFRELAFEVPRAALRIEPPRIAGRLIQEQVPNTAAG